MLGIICNVLQYVSTPSIIFRACVKMGLNLLIYKINDEKKVKMKTKQYKN